MSDPDRTPQQQLEEVAALLREMLEYQKDILACLQDAQQPRPGGSRRVEVFTRNPHEPGTLY